METEPGANPQLAARQFFRLFLVLCLVLAGLILINSRLFLIRRVEVRGNRTVPTADLLVASGLNLGQNIFQVNKRVAVRAILANPRIAMVQIKRQLPDRLLIIVLERTPACLIQHLENWLIVSDGATVIGVSSSPTAEVLPRVNGLRLTRVRVGETIDSPGLKVALEIIDYCGAKLRPVLAVVDLVQHRLYLNGPQGALVPVELGSLTDLEEKMANLRAIVANRSLARLTSVDLRVPDLPTVTTTR